MQRLAVAAARHARDRAGEAIRIEGWVRTVRKQKSVAFLDVNDGSSVKGCQVVVPAEDLAAGGGKDVAVGSAVAVVGRLVPGPVSHGEMELDAGVRDGGSISVLGTVDTDSFPLQKKYHSLEFLRDHLHLRPRTNTAAAILRLRHCVASSVRRYLDDRGFIEVHTPIITASDCEGAGEQFEIRVAHDADGGSGHGPSDGCDSDGDSVGFFRSPAYLTVSGQMHAEALACAMGRVYTFGPTFRAENSHTSRHLAEFWMVEPEMAFATMEDAIETAQGTLQAAFRDILEHCAEDVAFFSQRYGAKGKGKKGKGKNGKAQQQQEEDDELAPRALLERLCEGSFARLTYTEAVEALARSDLPSALRPSWGADLSSDMERWLVEKHCGRKPLVVTDYPATLKPFYMRQNDDGKTVAAFDVLLPGVGEVVGGSAREERRDLLESAMCAKQLENMDWYVDLRRHGTVPHAGFGIGFERLVMACSGIKNVRDCVPFPRTAGQISL